MHLPEKSASVHAGSEDIWVESETDLMIVPYIRIFPPNCGPTRARNFLYVSANELECVRTDAICNPYGNRCSVVHSRGMALTEIGDLNQAKVYLETRRLCEVRMNLVPGTLQ